MNESLEIGETSMYSLKKKNKHWMAKWEKNGQELLWLAQNAPKN